MSFSKGGFWGGGVFWEVGEKRRLFWLPRRSQCPKDCRGHSSEVVRKLNMAQVERETDFNNHLERACLLDPPQWLQLSRVCFPILQKPADLPGFREVF